MLCLYNVPRYSIYNNLSSLFSYASVIGCANLILPSPTVFERFDDSAFVSCPNNSKRKYPLKCEGNQWQGRYKNCTENDDIIGVNKDDGPSLDAVSQDGAHEWLPFALGDQIC